MMKFRQTKVVKTLNFKGFKLSIINNCYYSLRYEYLIEAISKQNKYVLKRKIKPIKKFINQRFDMVYDSTSHKTIKTALYYALVNVKDLHYRVSCPRLRWE